MKVSASMKIAVVVSLGTLCAGAALFSGCKEEEHRRSSPTEAGVAAEDGGPCVAAPGQLPTPNCDNSTNDCRSKTGCQIDEAKCGSKSGCLAYASNKGKQVYDFRLRRINIAAPDTLSQQFIQSAIVTANVDLNAKTCGEFGKGTFTWLLRVDKPNKKLITGGAPPEQDPFTKGYCFYNREKNGIKVQPVTVDLDITDNPDGKSFVFKTVNPKGKLNVPIFLTPDGQSVVILPLTNTRIEKVTVSQEGDCIGGFNYSALDNDCSDDPSSCSKWITAGSLGGFITLEEADNVEIKELSKSLCVLLTKSEKDPATNKCKRENGKIPFKGDYCSTSDKPGDCQDSFWLAATFAASATKINDGSSTPDCQGLPPDDAGTDAAADGGQDAGLDAPTD
jgi:hypothetical protein